mmetsp:Transcript_30378/g.71668  ORF Transcript_30378/g.71668 Transcript_30378/m.71668 type:complete len:97 (-) Transcript_30378:1032-1322(-)|eukprot:CAMPEP_0172376480 /NCGR_PEP_ID=MMETSP1060-20121228/67196_1 /TAXON_ID=37318 /ORGANISM="Pseudo-nitzschia pungens, Strain cf. cingulata" /LENGTH=96 /DNA_ID=CAMNT_0013104029 /DNA_START=59 /DNA_END=349 /DNA_ORIENTATION=+
MTDKSSTPPPATSSDTTTASPSASATTWELPVGIEDDIEHALIKTAVGAAAGGLFGLMFLRSGNGRRVASIATGVGAALGSSYERVKFRYEQQESK